MSHLSALTRRLSKIPEAAKDIRCGRTKATAITKNVLGSERFEELVCLLQKNKFSIIIDESTDKSCVKQMAIVARVVSNNFNIEDSFLGLLEVTDASASGIHKLTVDFFEKHKIPYKLNMVGFAADGANAMMGCRHSVSVLFKQECENLFVMRCISHSFHLCASDACSEIPNNIEEFLRDVHNYLSNSPKRTYEFSAFQEIWDLKPHKILHPSATRWLSLLMCIVRILKHYPALKMYFRVEAMQNQSDKAKKISQTIENPVTKLYLMFLDFILPFFNNINKEMQSESIKIHVIYNRIITFFSTVLEFFIKPVVFQNTDVLSIKYEQLENWVPLGDVYLGGSVTFALMDESNALCQEDISTFRRNCLNFYIETARRILQRFPFQEMDVLKQISVLDPKNMRNSPSIISLAKYFLNIIPNTEFNVLDSEWRSVRNMKELDFEKGIEEFWMIVGNIRKGDGTQMFPNLSLLLQNILVFPHSSATVERIFSQINLNKTRSRNRLGIETMSGILHSKRLFKNQTCYEIIYNKVHFSKFNTNIYNEK